MFLKEIGVKPCLQIMRQKLVVFDFWYTDFSEQKKYLTKNHWLKACSSTSFDDIATDQKLLSKALVQTHQQWRLSGRLRWIILIYSLVIFNFHLCGFLSVDSFIDFLWATNLGQLLASRIGEILSLEKL